MKQIFDFFKTNIYAILWAVGYVAVMWLVMTFLFDFDMFSYRAWIRAFGSHLHGFHGFVFGILLLAAVPMYIATTLVAFRTKKPLINLPVPKIIIDAFAPPPPPPAPDPTPAATDADNAPDAQIHQFHDNIPRELHGAFLRTRHDGGVRTTSAFDMSRVQFGTSGTRAAGAPEQTPVPAPVHTAAAAAPIAAPAQNQTSTDMADDFPLPADFNITDDISSFMQAPNFSDVTFDAPAEQTPTRTAPDTSSNADIAIDSGVSSVMEKLISAGRAPTRDNDLVICDGMVIATHCDNDFWIADDTEWFANGTQRPSPIIKLTARAMSDGLIPILYLGATNIMDMDACVDKWTAAGIRIITNLDELI